MTASKQLALVLALVATSSGCAGHRRARVVTLTGACSEARDEASANVCAGFLVDLIMTTQFGLYADEDLTRYVTRVGERLVAASAAADHDFTFRVLDEAGAQAWAAPGDFVYVTRGLLAQLSSEAELAAVLAHELGHVLAGHTDQLWGALPETAVSELASRRLSFDHERDEERQADHLAIVLLDRSGYDPRAVARMLVALAPAQASHQGESWASRHPPIASRVALVVRALDGRGGGGRGRAAYASRIDGLVVGDDPRRGHLTDTQFVYPRAGFAIDLPSGWRVSERDRPSHDDESEADNELLVRRLGSSSFGPSGDGPSGDGPSNAEPEHAPVERREVAGFDVRVTSRPAAPDPAHGGARRVTHIAVFEAESGFYALVATGPTNATDEVKAAFDAVVASLQRVSPDAGPAPTRLRAFVVETPGTLLQLATAMCGAPEDEAVLESINAMAVGTEVPEGSVIKCLR